MRSLAERKQFYEGLREVLEIPSKITHREQKLVDLCFEMVYRAIRDPVFCKEKTREEHMAWVANNLKECGFPTRPIGMSWGVLIEETDSDLG